MAEESGYTLDLLISWLEDMVADEDERSGTSGPYRERLNKAYDALALLEEVSRR